MQYELCYYEYITLAICVLPRVTATVYNSSLFLKNKIELSHEKNQIKLHNVIERDAFNCPGTVSHITRFIFRIQDQNLNNCLDASKVLCILIEIF